MTKTKTILTALALTTALTAPVLIVPMLSAPPAIAGQAVVQDLSDLAAKVTPAVVNVAVTMKAGAATTTKPRCPTARSSRTRWKSSCSASPSASASRASPACRR